MCGICGIINFINDPVSKVSLNKMMHTMKHRGPDDEGVFIEGNIGLGFVRLSILDLSEAGHQPMFRSDRVRSEKLKDFARYVIVFNGEIFNYLELRDELQGLGYTFKTSTDTEVLLAASIEWGEKCLHKLNGMWAFAIYDQLEKSVFISRDRYGIKPLYYYCDNQRFIFASEIPPILSILDHRPAPYQQSIFEYLVFNRTDQTENTFFEGIIKLQHGHNLKFSVSHSSNHPLTCSPIKWYDLQSNLKPPLKSPEEFRQLFSDSVGLRLRSDVPVGVCLSGGIDSSSIVSVLLKDYNKKDLNTFSAIYRKGQFGDESEFINLYRKELEYMFFTTPDSETLFADISDFVSTHAEPIPSTAPYAQYKVMELAQKQVVVTLDGQGADEMLAGYHYFFGFFFKDLFKKGKIGHLTKEMINYYNIHRSLYGLKSFAYFMLPERIRTKIRVREKGYLTERFIKETGIKNTIAGNLYGSGNLHNAMLDHFEYKLEHLLKWEDRNSMRFSIEARLPFLDHRLVERTLNMPGEMVIRNGMTKHPLRESMKGTLHEEIRIRKDKMGFDTPQDEWLRKPVFQELVKGILGSGSFRSRGIIDYKKAEKIYQNYITGKINISKEIWKWIHLEMWFREFID